MIQKDKLCDKCGVNPATELHPCPYNVEMYEDYRKNCICCPECEWECLQDVDAHLIK